MKIVALAAHLNLPEKSVTDAGASLGIPSDQDISAADLDRIKTLLESSHQVDPAAFDALKAKAAPSAPRLAEPAPGGASIRPSSTASDSSDPAPGRLDLSAFGHIGRNIVSRRDRNDIILKRKTRNCGDTAGMVLEGLRKRAATTTERDVDRARVLEALSKPATKHEVWDITVHQHTFTLERYPDGSNMLIQSYQPGYSVQHWCGLDDPYLDNEALADLPQDWFQPTDALVRKLGATIASLYDGPQENRQMVWTQLPFNPQDPLVESDRMENLAFSANHITFSEPTSMGASLAGLKDSIAELSG